MIALHFPPFHQDPHGSFFVLPDETVCSHHGLNYFLNFFRLLLDRLEVSANSDERETKNLVRSEKHVESHLPSQGVAGRGNHSHIHQTFLERGEARAIWPESDELEIFVRIQAEGFQHHATRHLVGPPEVADPDGSPLKLFA